MWSRIQDVVSSLLYVIQFLYFTVSAGVWDNQLFPLPQPLCLPEGIYSPFSAVLYNLCKWYPWQNRQIVCATTETNSLCLGLPQANSSLFKPAAALVYPSRQHQKSDNYHRCALLEWKSGALVMHGKVKNNYEHNVVIMNLFLSPKTADDVILSLDSKWTAKIKKLVGAYFLIESWFLWKLYFKNSYPKTGLNSPPPPPLPPKKKWKDVHQVRIDLQSSRVWSQWLTSAPTSMMIWILIKDEILVWDNSIQFNKIIFTAICMLT